MDIDRIRVAEDFDTITAISTPEGIGALSVIRVSGAKSESIARELFRSRSGAPLKFKERYLHYGRIVGAGGVLIDEATAILLKSPKSYTAEDMLEIIAHGSLIGPRAIVRRIVELGARPARRGEFTKRAFLNGRIDLTRAEAVGDLLGARCERAHKNALAQLDGVFAEEIKAIEERLVQALVLIEVSLDFPEDELEIIDDRSIRAQLDQAIARIDHLLESRRLGRIYKEGLKMALVGRPNSGKSSLLNAFLRADRAIVTDLAGATRDRIEESFQIDGIEFKLIDTAGIRHTEELIEREAIRRSLLTLDEADIVLILIDASLPLDEEIFDFISSIDARARRAKRYILLTKRDLGLKIAPRDFNSIAPGRSAVPISTKSEEDIERLEGIILSDLLDLSRSLTEPPVLMRERHHNLLKQARSHLFNARDATDAGLGRELIAAELVGCKAAFEELTGASIDEATLDKIFSAHCIGK